MKLIRYIYMGAWGDTLSESFYRLEEGADNPTPISRNQFHSTAITAYRNPNVTVAITIIHPSTVHTIQEG